jgi:hypothetical protein
MVGGKVIGLARRVDRVAKGAARGQSIGPVMVHVQGTAGESRETCVVHCLEETAEAGERVVIQLGDSIWWQGERVYWTSRHVGTVSAKQPCGRADVALPKVGPGGS